MPALSRREISVCDSIDTANFSWNVGKSPIGSSTVALLQKVPHHHHSCVPAPQDTAPAGCGNNQGRLRYRHHPMPQQDPLALALSDPKAAYRSPPLPSVTSQGRIATEEKNAASAAATTMEPQPIALALQTRAFLGEDGETAFRSTISSSSHQNSTAGAQQTVATATDNSTISQQSDSMMDDMRGRDVASKIAGKPTGGTVDDDVSSGGRPARHYGNDKRRNRDPAGSKPVVVGRLGDGKVRHSSASLQAETESASSTASDQQRRAEIEASCVVGQTATRSDVRVASIDECASKFTASFSHR